MGRRIQELLAQDKVVRVFAVGQLCDPKIVEMIGFEGGFDAVWLDNEHAGLAPWKSRTLPVPHARLAWKPSSDWRLRIMPS